MSSLDRVFNIEDLRKIARRKLPKPLFNYIDGGADDESNVRGNTHAFDSVRLVPEYLVDVAGIDTSTKVLGREIRYIDQPIDEFAAVLRSIGVKEWRVGAVCKEFQAIADFVNHAH